MTLSCFLLDQGLKQEREEPTWDRCPDIVVPLLDMLISSALLCRRCC
jgi:hypothetical protein